MTKGITLPSSEAQIRNIRAVYQRAGLETDQTAFVECHGTGTQAGDPRELRAVGEALCGNRSIENPIFVGSLKTNIGHLEGCAGIAGLIKGILAVEHGIIPKHINFKVPGNPAIDFEGFKVKVRCTTLHLARLYTKSGCMIRSLLTTLPGLLKVFAVPASTASASAEPTPMLLLMMQPIISTSEVS